MQQNILEIYGHNIATIRSALAETADKSNLEHGALFKTIASMLAGRQMDWTEVQNTLMASGSSSPVGSSAPSRPAYRRQHSTDSKPALAKNVQEVGIDGRVGEQRINMPRRRKDEMICGLPF